MFVDYVKINASAGSGGNGCVSFRRAKYIPKGGPDGGDGGKGASIFLQVDNNCDNLRNFFFKPIIKAKNGNHGAGQCKTGKSAKDITLLVPPGTVVHILQKDKSKTLLKDLNSQEEKFCLVKGGKGGKGNINFKNSINQAPIEFTEGEIGEKGEFILELKSIADIGLVGFPNAGKSSLLKAISSAKPKTAPYPFTTLKPNIGIVKFENKFVKKIISVADIPGIIKEASRNKGLGFEFLRHISRCNTLFFVVDTASVDCRNPVDDIIQLRIEIKNYSEELAIKKWIIIANKIDLPEADENLKILQGRFSKIKIIPFSATKKINLEKMLSFIKKINNHVK